MWKKFEKISPEEQEEFEKVVFAEQEKKLDEMFHKMKNIAIPKDQKANIEELFGKRLPDNDEDGPESKLMESEISEIFKKGGLGSKYKWRNYTLDEIYKSGN